jgi:hypothetical protein
MVPHTPEFASFLGLENRVFHKFHPVMPTTINNYRFNNMD